MHIEMGGWKQTWFSSQSSPTLTDVSADVSLSQIYGIGFSKLSWKRLQPENLLQPAFFLAIIFIFIVIYSFYVRENFSIYRIVIGIAQDIRWFLNDIYVTVYECFFSLP